MPRRTKDDPAPNDPRYLRTCTRCGHVRPWRQPCVVKTVPTAMDPEILERRGFLLPADMVVGEEWEHWIDFGCPKCGNPEFSLPGPATADDRDEGALGADDGSGVCPSQLMLWSD